MLERILKLMSWPTELMLNRLKASGKCPACGHQISQEDIEGEEWTEPAKSFSFGGNQLYQRLGNCPNCNKTLTADRGGIYGPGSITFRVATEEEKRNWQESIKTL